MKRKTCRSLRAPSTSSTMKLSFSSCRCCRGWGAGQGGGGLGLHAPDLQPSHPLPSAPSTSSARKHTRQTPCSLFIEVPKPQTESQPLVWRPEETLQPRRRESPSEQGGPHIPRTGLETQARGRPREEGTFSYGDRQGSGNKSLGLGLEGTAW